MKSLYYQLLNLVQNMNWLIYMTIWIVLLILSLVSFIDFWKNADTEKNKFKKPLKVVSAIVFFLLLIFWSSLRK